MKSAVLYGDWKRVPCMSVYLASDGWRITNRPTETTDTKFGLLRLEANVYANKPLADAHVEINAATNNLSFNVAKFGIDRGNGIWSLGFYLNTHFLANGQVTLQSAINLGDDGVFDLPPFELNISNIGALADTVRDAMRSAGTPTMFAEDVDSRLFPYETGQGLPWFNSPEAIADAADTPLSFEPAADADTARRHMVRWGFAILPDVLPDPIIDAFNKAAAEAVEDGRLPWQKGSSQRIHNAHRMPEGRAIWLYPPVLDFLREWFRDEPCACQTLYYINGSEQNAHQDTIHLTPFPAGYMCGVWVPLEDVQPNSGELFVYPGSHRTERLMSGALGLAKVRNDYSSYVTFDAEVRRLLEENGYERAVYRPKRGQILVWHENLVHGGSPRIDPSITRLSIVSHYFAKGCVAYYDSRGEAAGLESLN